MRTADGTELFCEEIGDGDLTLVIPGAAWLERDLDYLAQAGRRVVFYDQRNRGRSGRSQLISIDQEIEDLEEVRRQFADGPVVTIGWSYLGAVVALHAARYPSSVCGVVMAAPMAPRQGVREYHVSDEVIEDYRHRWEPVRRRIEELDRELETAQDPEPLWRERSRANSAFRMAEPTSIDRMKSEPWRYANERPPLIDETFDALFNGLEDRDWRLGLDAITAPVLLFHGLVDGPEAMTEDWARATNGRLVAMVGVGHFPHLEDPDRFNAEVTQFLEAIDPHSTLR